MGDADRQVCAPLSLVNPPPAREISSEISDLTGKKREFSRRLMIGYISKQNQPGNAVKAKTILNVLFADVTPRCTRFAGQASALSSPAWGEISRAEQQRAMLETGVQRD